MRVLTEGLSFSNATEAPLEGGSSISSAKKSFDSKGVMTVESRRTKITRGLLLAILCSVLVVIAIAIAWGDIVVLWNLFVNPP